MHLFFMIIIAQTSSSNDEFLVPIQHNQSSEYTTDKMRTNNCLLKTEITNFQENIEYICLYKYLTPEMTKNFISHSKNLIKLLNEISEDEKITILAYDADLRLYLYNLIKFEYNARVIAHKNCLKLYNLMLKASIFLFTIIEVVEQESILNIAYEDILILKNMYTTIINDLKNNEDKFSLNVKIHTIYYFTKEQILICNKEDWIKMMQSFEFYQESIQKIKTNLLNLKNELHEKTEIVIQENIITVNKLISEIIIHFNDEQVFHKKNNMIKKMKAIQCFFSELESKNNKYLLKIKTIESTWENFQVKLTDSKILMNESWDILYAYSPINCELIYILQNIITFFETELLKVDCEAEKNCFLEDEYKYVTILKEKYQKWEKISKSTFHNRFSIESALDKYQKKIKLMSTENNESLWLMTDTVLNLSKNSIIETKKHSEKTRIAPKMSCFIHQKNPCDIEYEKTILILVKFVFLEVLSGAIIFIFVFLIKKI